MRILIGTLHTIENEIDECLASVRRQTYRCFEHFVVKGLPDREAHDALYSRFMKMADEYDLFLKLDADMVIENEQLLEQIVTVFEENPDIDMLSIPVYDYFSNQLALGMHTYRNTVKWLARDDVFTDKHNVPRNRILIDQGELTPAATHCQNPSPFQSFHLGLHRGVKVRVAMQRPIQWRSYLLTHVANIDHTWKHFLQQGNINLGLASLAAELSIQGEFKEEHIPYTNPHARVEFFRNYAIWDVDQIRSSVNRLRIENRMRYPLLLIVRGVSAWVYPTARALIPQSMRTWIVTQLDASES